MKFSLKDISKQLANSSTADLETLLSSIQKELHTHKLSDLVEYVPNLVEYVPKFVNVKLGNDLFQECESLNMSSDNPRKAASQWLSPVDEPYIYVDLNPIHHAKNIKLLPNTYNNYFIY